MNITRISTLSKLVTNDLKRKPTIVLEPNRTSSFRFSGVANDINLNIDPDEWTIPDNLESFIKELSKRNISIENKILVIYQKLCEDYTYDDNVLSYIKKNDDETFYLPDDYGRDTDASWKEKRKQHNRRNCFEISRILAKSLQEVLKNSGYSKSYDVCILWDEAVTHYFVGLVSNDLCISLDLDDFLQIKDITRLKTGLTIEGIKVLQDTSKRFTSALERFNDGKTKIARDYMEERFQKHVDEQNYTNSANITQEAETQEQQEKYNEAKAKVGTEHDIAEKAKEFDTTIDEESAEDSVFMESDNNESEDIQFLRFVIQILKDDFNLDSAGMFEYLKEIVDTRIGGKARNKVWKEVENNSGTGARYTRCLLVKIDDILYIMDVTKENSSEVLREFNGEELNDPNSKLKSFKTLVRDWDDDPYDGR